MSGPTHLWAGDWESESRQPASAQLPAFDQEPETEPQPAQIASRRFSRRQLLTALTVGVASAAVAATLIVVFAGGTAPRRHAHPASQSAKGQPQNSGGGSLKTPAQPCQQTAVGCGSTTAAATIVNGPSADWMGMQIVTSPSGVVVNTVKLGSTADVAGFEPGDQILAIDTHVIGTVSELRLDTAGVHVGGLVTVAVMRQSVELKLASIHMTQRPTVHP